ncbi:MAG: hypothetical protein SO101_16325 [Lachnospiraceae bacterium]|nr:hypothetical protein [Lachnospiraceae bacterium]
MKEREKSIIDDRQDIMDERVLSTLTTAHTELSRQEAEAAEQAIRNLPDTEEERNC